MGEKRSYPCAGNRTLEAMKSAPSHHFVCARVDARLTGREITPVREHRRPAVLRVLSWSEFANEASTREPDR
jgi:hypothetical protein